MSRQLRRRILGMTPESDPWWHVFAAFGVLVGGYLLVILYFASWPQWAWNHDCHPTSNVRLVEGRTQIEWLCRDDRRVWH